MENREDKELDALIRKMLQNTELDSPSEHFTHKVMQDVELLAAAKKQKSSPLIPKPVWGILAAVYAIILTFFFKNDILSSDGWFSALGERTSSLFNLEIPGLQFSSALIYGVLCAALVVMGQVVVLRRRVS